jgi:signal transduction histidine kinase
MAGMRASPVSSRTSFALAAIAALALLLGGAPAGRAGPALAQPTPGHPPDTRVYRVGIDRQFPPYAFADRAGNPHGFVVDLLTAISEGMRIRLEWRVGEYAELLAALQKGQIDILPTLPSSLASEETLALSLPHSSMADGVFVRADGRPIGGNPLNDLDGKSVVVMADDPALDYVRGTSPNAKLLIEPSLADALRRLAAGSGDLALLPSRPGVLVMRQLQLTNLRLLPIQVDEYPRALTFAVRRSDVELLNKLEQGMVLVTGNGTFLKVYNDWEQYRGDSDLADRLLLWVGGPVLFLLILSMAWTWSLRREVARRTEALRRAEAEKRAFEARIAQTQRLESLAVLAGGVAHDFNNLLMAMLGNTSLALLQTPADSQTAIRLREVEKAGRRAAELCQQMLNYSGKGSFIIEPIDLTQLVRGIGDLVEASISKKARLELQLAEGLPPINGDAGQLRQLVLNLVANASDSLQDRSGIVRVKTSATEKPISPRTDLGERLAEGFYVLLEVVDDGVGMDEQTRTRIFEPFFTTKFTGRGLGLAATLGILRGHHGGIQVESRLGEGSTFRIYFPVLTAEAARAWAARTRAAAMPSTPAMPSAGL